MKPEEKDLLLKDLSARLPYGVIISVKDINNFQFDGILQVIGKNWCRLNILDPIKKAKVKNQTIPLNHIYIKPYLRPMSSMTEEEKKEYIEYAGYEIEESVNGKHYEYYLKDFCGTPNNPSVNADGVDWLNKKMFDFRGLIPKDLALSTDEFNPYIDNLI